MEKAICSICVKPMPESEQIVAYALWSNEMYISEPGQVGVIHGRLFESLEAAQAFYEVSGKNALKNGVFVKVTVEKCR
jgi:hypothetical protein